MTICKEGGPLKALYKIHLDLHTPEWDSSILENFDPKQVVGTVARSGAKVLYFFAKDHYGNAYYNTSVGHKHRCIGERDLLAEVILEAKKTGVEIVAYYSAIWDNHAAQAHPEWQLLSLPLNASDSEEPQAPSGIWQHLCHNSAYVDYAVSMIKEIAAGYDISGFHLDMLNMDFEGISCYCASCQRLFRERTGKELPRTPSTDPIWREFLEFRYESVERFALALRQAIHQVKPGLFVETNYHGSPSFDWRAGQKPVRHSLYSDLNTGETYTPMLGDMYPGMEARFVRNLSPGKPFELVCWRMNRHTDFTTKPIHQLRWELFTALANGAITMIIDQPFHDGRLDEYPYSMMGEIFQEVESKRISFGGIPIKHVGILYSCKTRDYYGLDHPEKFLLPVMGAYKALVESHIPVDFLFDESLSLDSLLAFPVVFLPNVACMSQFESEILSEYVASGGTLIASFDTSRYSETGERLPDFQLANVFGTNYLESLDCDVNYLKGFSGPYGNDIDPRYYILNIGQAHLVRCTTAEPVGELYDAFFKRRIPEQFYSHNIHPPYLRRSDALYINRYGKGTCAYFPHGCDASYANLYELPEHRNLIRNVVLACGVPPEVQIRAPLNVESVIARKDGRLVIHLLGFNPIRQATTLLSLSKPVRPSIRMEEPGIYRAEIQFNRRIKSCQVLGRKTEWEANANHLCITCEDVHEAIIVELE